VAKATLALNPRQRDAVLEPGHLCLKSCPGSGKTRTIVAKILWCLDELRGTNRKVGCITYTNAAVSEIEDRLRARALPDDELCYDVSTIHSFCLNHILRPYHYHLPTFSNGFEIKAPDDPWFEETVKVLARKYQIRSWAAQRFEGVQREPDGSITVPSGIPSDAADEFLSELDRNAYVTLNGIVYYSYLLVVDLPFISRGLASRFAWLLIDEFQDTTAAQVAILQIMHAHNRSHFFIVGDPNQSIYGFAGARPTLMDDFARHIDARTEVDPKIRTVC
jgi:DNA helicase-2/ATP-dependent DNA helicase PcrA